MTTGPSGLTRGVTPRIRPTLVSPGRSSLPAGAGARTPPRRGIFCPSWIKAGLLSSVARRTRAIVSICGGAADDVQRLLTGGRRRRAIGLGSLGRLRLDGRRLADHDFDQNGGRRYVELACDPPNFIDHVGRTRDQQRCC